MFIYKYKVYLNWRRLTTKRSVNNVTIGSSPKKTLSIVKQLDMCINQLSAIRGVKYEYEAWFYFAKQRKTHQNFKYMYFSIDRGRQNSLKVPLNKYVTKKSCRTHCALRIRVPLEGSVPMKIVIENILLFYSFLQMYVLGVWFLIFFVVSTVLKSRFINSLLKNF